jgi:hypothetical protein
MASSAWVEARGNHRFVLDQKWKEVQETRKKQDARFKAIERQADQGMKSFSVPCAMDQKR